MSDNKDQRYYWFAMQTIPGLGAVRCNVLIKRFGSPQAALDAPKSALMKIPDFGEKMAAALKSGANYEEADRQMKLLEDSGSRMVTIRDDNYPEWLKQIYDPPIFLLLSGDLLPQDHTAVAIVGSRACTRYGRQIAEQLAGELVGAGLTIVSGLARGIDSAAHRGALKAGGRTLGVLGCGLDVVYPPENKTLYAEVSQSGALVSEFLFGTKPEKYNFPSRNRIISGLCKGVILIEAGRSSGALLTAKHALDQNREVLAVPGNINSSASQGTNELLKQGAVPVTSSADVLLTLGLDPRSKPARAATENLKLPEAEKKVLGYLTDQPQQVDRISEALSQPVPKVLASLLNLEMAGLVRQMPGKLFLKS